MNCNAVILGTRPAILGMVVCSSSLLVLGACKASRADDAAKLAGSWKLVSYEDYKPLMIRPDKRGRISPLERVRAVASTWFFEDRIAPVTSTDLEHSKHDAH